MRCPWWWRAVLVAPFAAVIDLGGVVTSAFADARQRLGESAYGWRILSAGSVTVGVAINVAGHDVPYLAVVFGGLGVFAYAVWLLHSAGRRRDALRAAGKLADTPPAYGVTQWWREPRVTRRARALALAHRYPLHESLSVARQQLRDEQRRAALAHHVQTLIRSRHDDPVRAAIAATTLDIDAVAAQLTAQSDVIGWARVIGTDLLPPRGRTAADIPHGISSGPPGPPPVAGRRMPPADVLRRSRRTRRPTTGGGSCGPSSRPTPASCGRVRRPARHLPAARSVDPPHRHQGLLDSPIPLLARIAQMATGNGPAPYPRSPAS
jgi:hypothetical protein